MAANTTPIFTNVPDHSNNAGTGFYSGTSIGTAAANDYTGIDTDYQLVFTADATDGSYVERIRFVSRGTNIATVARIFLNNGSAVGTATNNQMYGQQSLPATTAIDTAATVEIDYPMRIALAAGERIYVGCATAVAAGWSVVVVGGRY